MSVPSSCLTTLSVILLFAIVPPASAQPAVLSPEPSASAPVLPLLEPPANPPKLPALKSVEGYTGLPINLATALRLAENRPLVIQAAEAAVLTELGRLQRARALWLPTISAGFGYTRHDGGLPIPPGGEETSISRNEFLLGAGPRAVFAFSDAIYAPLVAEQTLRARQFDVQAARNDALLETAEAYFLVQESRGRLAGAQDAAEKARLLATRIDKLGQGLAPPIEAERARTTLADFELQLAAARRDWRIAGARLTRVLRLNPAAVVEPLEPPQLRITLVSPSEAVDNLIPIGLTNRPELASQQALVQATLAAIRREQLRPLIPSLAFQGNAMPGERLAGGLYATGLNSSLGNATYRSDFNVQLVWEFENLGLGNRGRRTQTRGENLRTVVELLRMQDSVAAEIAQAHAEIEAANTQIITAIEGLTAASKSYEGNLKGLSETVRLGETLQLVARPLEVVAALQQLQQAYSHYYVAVNSYNRAQFRMFRALGYPAQDLATRSELGNPQPIDTTRPCPLPPVP